MSRSNRHLGAGPLGVCLAVVLGSSPLLPGPSFAVFHPANADLAPAPPEVLERSIQSLEGRKTLSGHSSSVDQYCGTPDLLALDRGWTQLSDDQRTRVARATAPTDWTSPAGQQSTEERGGLPCFWNLVNSIESDHFKVQWGDSAVVDPDEVDWLLAHLEDARLAFLEAGYHQPLGNPGNKIPVYLGNSGGASPSIDFSGGYATVCNNFEHAYFVLSSLSIALTRDVANHELFHTVQSGSPDPYPIEGYYWEASAVWAEQLAEPAYTAYSELLPAYTNHTEWPLALGDEIASPDGFLHKYAMFILPIYIEEFAPAGGDALLEVWNGGGEGLVSRLDTFWDNTGGDTDFNDQFGHFTNYVSVMDFDHQSTYLPYSVVPKGIIEAGTRHEETGVLGLYGSHYFRLASADEGGELRGLHVEFDGPPGWIVAVSRSSEGRVLTSRVGLADGEGQLTLEATDSEGLADESWIVVSNASGTGRDYVLRAEMVMAGPSDSFGGEGNGCASCAGPQDPGHPFEHGAGWLLLAFLCPSFGLRRRPPQ